MKRKTVEFVREGRYAAEIAVELIENAEEWSPHLSLQDARKLDAVRLALRNGDVSGAAKFGRVFELLPLTA